VHAHGYSLNGILNPTTEDSPVSSPEATPQRPLPI
jgi:hypothetical protein